MKAVKKWAPVAAAVLGLVAVFMIFVASIVIRTAPDHYYTGLQVVFGYKENSFTEFTFSFFNLLPYLLTLGGIVLVVLNFLGKGKDFFVWIAVALFVVAAILFFMTIACCWMTMFDGATAAEIDEFKNETMLLGAGPIISGICTILAAIATATPFALDKLVK